MGFTTKNKSFYSKTLNNLTWIKMLNIQHWLDVRIIDKKNQVKDYKQDLFDKKYKRYKKQNNDITK